MFIRMYNCNLECTWCDTAYTWADTPQKAAKTVSGHQYDRYDPHLGLKNMTTPEALAALQKCWDYMAMPTIVVISGGEPMMQQKDLIDFMQALRRWSNEIHIETAGTIAPTYEFGQLVTQYNVSPKLNHSGNRLELRYKPEVLRILRGSGKAWFKFVVSELPPLYDQFVEIDKIVTECNIPVNRVQVMPECTNVTDMLTISRWVADAAIERGYGVSFRTHILLWGQDVDK